MLSYHRGRVSQEGVFAELKSHCNMEYIPPRTLHRKAAYLLARHFAFNFDPGIENAKPTAGSKHNQQSSITVGFRKSAYDSQDSHSASGTSITSKLQANLNVLRPPELERAYRRFFGCDYHGSVGHCFF
jgi:hypothetical protein